MSFCWGAVHFGEVGVVFCLLSGLGCFASCFVRFCGFFIGFKGSGFYGGVVFSIVVSFRHGLAAWLWWLR